MFLFISDSQIVPCTARLAFNKLVHERVLFRSCGHRYNVRVFKGQSKTRLHGERWEQFIMENNISVGDNLVISMTPDPMISVALIGGGSEDDGSDEDSDNSDDDTSGDGKRIIVAQ